MTDPLTADSLRAQFRRGTDASAAATEPAPVAPTTPAVRANKFGKSCHLCQGYVPEGAGELLRHNDTWSVQHLQPCPDPAPAGDPVQVAAATVVPPASTELVEQVTIKAVTGQVYTGLQPGTYTVLTQTGHRTFRVRVQGSEEDFAPGKTVLDALTGTDNTHDFTTVGFLSTAGRVGFFKRYAGEGSEALRADAAVLLADPAAALVAKECLRCQRPLTTPASIAAGLGPTCLDKGW